MTQNDYDKCKRRHDLYAQLLFDRLAEGKTDEAKYARVTDKLAEWQRELRRKQPREMASTFR